MPRGEPRYYPFMVLNLLVFALVDSSFRAVTAAFGLDSSLSGGRAAIWLRLDTTNLTSLLISASIVWAFLDRRRVQIGEYFVSIDGAGTLVAGFATTVGCILASVCIMLAANSAAILAPVAAYCCIALLSVALQSMINRRNRG